MDSEYLYEGAIIVRKEPTLITTILGTCVAVSLFDPVTHIGGLNHYLLPYYKGRGLPSPHFGNVAIESMIDKMLEYGAHKNRLEAKILGGKRTDESIFSIGIRNAEVAVEILAKHRIPVKASKTGADTGLKVIFNTYSGDFQVKRIVETMKVLK